MSAASNFLESALLEHFRGTQLPLPSNFFVALHTADPTDAANATEVTLAAWPSYARQTVGIPLSSAWTASADEAGGGKQITNANTLNFPANNGASSVQVTHFSIWDSGNGGNMWAHAALTAPKTIDPTDIFSAIPGALRLISR
ncbi:phage tail fiber protein [Pseudomonas anguilliseptica]|uniref:phage tail fiber protein n=1 Tax=Pseudomonas anguilliseptica TaxID=53406 RepID=UPI00325BAA40